jgi:hypothetical protein
MRKIKPSFIEANLGHEVVERDTTLNQNALGWAPPGRKYGRSRRQGIGAIMHTDEFPLSA